jgi:hypothetical protein
MPRQAGSCLSCQTLERSLCEQCKGFGLFIHVSRLLRHQPSIAPYICHHFYFTLLAAIEAMHPQEVCRSLFQALCHPLSSAYAASSQAASVRPLFLRSAGLRRPAALPLGSQVSVRFSKALAFYTSLCFSLRLMTSCSRLACLRLLSLPLAPLCHFHHRLRLQSYASTSLASLVVPRSKSRSNHSIERASSGKPAAASHLKR